MVFKSERVRAIDNVRLDNGYIVLEGRKVTIDYRNGTAHVYEDGRLGRLLGDLPPSEVPQLFEHLECDETACQACCMHDEHDHGICNDCGLDRTGDLVAQADARFEGDR